MVKSCFLLFPSMLIQAPVMLRKNLIIAIRHLLRHKTDTFIKMISLCLGITGCLLIAFFVHHEWRYDTFHSNKDRLYRIVDHTSSPSFLFPFR